MPGVSMDEHELRSSCREVLEPYKVPRGFAFMDQLPRTMTGKTDKKMLASTAV
jgi:long-chain acyl-CoA synthetase